jgi:hypothetical protein
MPKEFRVTNEHLWRVKEEARLRIFRIEGRETGAVIETRMRMSATTFTREGDPPQSHGGT